MSKYIVFMYEDTHGKNPIQEFINKSIKSQKAKIIRQIEYLEMFGITPLNPMLKKLSNTNIWEMRSLGKDNLRIFCASYNSGIVILHIFIKKTQKTNKKDLLIATKRLSELLD